MNLPYPDLKALIAKKNLAWQYEERSTRYIVFAVDGPLIYKSIIHKSNSGLGGLDLAEELANQTDFEDNYKTAANTAVGAITDSYLGKSNTNTVSSPKIAYDIINNHGYRVSVETNISLSTENNLIHLKNPAGSGKVLILDRVALNCITRGESILRMYDAATITGNGTVITIKSSNVGGGASASAMNAYTSPTTSSLGSKFDVYAMGKDSNTMIVDFDGHTVLSAGSSIIITVQNDSVNRTVSVTAMWREI